MWVGCARATRLRVSSPEVSLETRVLTVWEAQTSSGDLPRPLHQCIAGAQMIYSSSREIDLD